MGLHAPRGVGTIVEEGSEDSQLRTVKGLQKSLHDMGISAPGACFHSWLCFHESLFCFALEVSLNAYFWTHTDIRQQVTFLLGSQSHPSSLQH